MQRKKILHCLQRVLNSQPLVYKTSALPLSYRGFLCNSSPDRKEHIHWRDQSLLRWRHWNHETSPLNVFHLWCFTKNHWTSQLNFWVIIHAKVGLDRDLNPGPRAPEARIIPLDHQAMIACSLTTRILFFFSLNILLISTFLNRCQKKRKKNLLKI